MGGGKKKEGRGCARLGGGEGRRRGKGRQRAHDNVKTSKLFSLQEVLQKVGKRSILCGAAACARWGNDSHPEPSSRRAARLPEAPGRIAGW